MSNAFLRSVLTADKKLFDSPTTAASKAPKVSCQHRRETAFKQVLSITHSLS